MAFSLWQIKDQFQNPIEFYVMRSAQCDAETIQDILQDKRSYRNRAAGEQGMFYILILMTRRDSIVYWAFFHGHILDIG